MGCGSAARHVDRWPGQGQLAANKGAGEPGSATSRLRRNVIEKKENGKSSGKRTLKDLDAKGKGREIKGGARPGSGGDFPIES